MPATSAASLALAVRLRDLDDAVVARVIRERAIAPASLRDVFDLAEALLDPAALAIALSGLTRRALAALATAAEHPDGATPGELAARLDRTPDEVLQALAPALDALLADHDGTRVIVWPAVAAELAAWPARGLPSAAELRSAAPPAVLAPVDDADRRFLDRGAAERAFTTTTAVTEVVLALADAPARLLARGGLSLPDAKRLAAAAGCELDDVATLTDLAALAGLIDDEAGFTRPTEAGDTWRRGLLAARWSALAAAWREALPAELVALLAERADSRWGAGLADFLDWLYPAGGEALLARLRRRGLQADRLGIAVDGRPSSIGRVLVAEGAEPAAAVLAPLVPAEVEQVYLQHDLTIVSPGPLAGAIDERLRRVAEVESSGLAGRYRITADSVTRAIAMGETAAGLSQFLASISLTGVPQPLAYLIDETARRYGAVRVGALEPDEAAELGARTGVRSDEPLLLETILVDAATASLALRRVGPHRAVSRFDTDVVLWTLIDARYPAAADEGTTTPERPGRTRSRPAPTVVDDSVAAAVARIRSGSTVGVDGDSAWVARQWELALRGKLSLRATVRLPDGSERSFDLEPTGIAAGRVRGRDKAADIERTLPVSSITALEPLE
ncbi:helicase-associated domain-containing protein [Microcella humidisoli]|uniref:Helicase-associated domain-containing protein n=1 Tax=Microcella humidisoli TaxID=2963406 RepID=A0ABY5FUQ6_9MICO|nr:helicase-associated domain-containing protein [Microcella humidisoli]UTT61506.1 helicase-associated domain-containing protein [Microcella humidisoli]